MYSDGWMLERIIFSSLFLFKKVESREGKIKILVDKRHGKPSGEIDGELGTLEMEKPKYICSSKRLHVFLDQSCDNKMPIEKSKVLEIAEKEKNNVLVPIAILAFVYLFLITINRLHLFRDGLAEVMIIASALYIGLEIRKRKLMVRFIGINEEENNNLTYLKVMNKANSKISGLFTLTFYLMVIFVMGYSIIYNLGIEDRYVIIFLLVIVGLVYYINKGSWKEMPTRDKILIGVLIILSIMPIRVFLDGFIIQEDDVEVVDTDGINVIRLEDVLGYSRDGIEFMDERSNILVPRGYRYESHAEMRSMITEYHGCFNDFVAKKIVKLRLRKSENFIKRYKKDFISMYESGLVDDRVLDRLNITSDEFNSFKNLDPKEASIELIDLAIEKNIVEYEDPDFKVDEFYFLDYKKKGMVIRKGREVYYIWGPEYDVGENAQMIQSFFE